MSAPRKPDIPIIKKEKITAKEIFGQISKDTEIVYLAIGCFQYNERYQAFPEFIKKKIDEGKKVQIIAIDPFYKASRQYVTERCAYKPRVATANEARCYENEFYNFSQSSLLEFLEKNPHYKNYIQIYASRYDYGRTQDDGTYKKDGNPGSDIEPILEYINGKSHQLVVLHCPGDPCLDNSMIQKMQKGEYANHENLHFLEQAVSSQDISKVMKYFCGKEGVWIDLSKEEFPEKKLMLRQEHDQPSNNSFRPGFS